MRLFEIAAQRRHGGQRGPELRHLTINHIAQKGCVRAGKTIILSEPGDRAQSLTHRIITVGGKLMTVDFRVGEHNHLSQDRGLGWIVVRPEYVEIIDMTHERRIPWTSGVGKLGARASR